MLIHRKEHKALLCCFQAEDELAFFFFSGRFYVLWTLYLRPDYLNSSGGGRGRMLHTARDAQTLSEL